MADDTADGAVGSKDGRRNSSDWPAPAGGVELVRIGQRDSLTVFDGSSALSSGSVAAANDSPLRRNQYLAQTSSNGRMKKIDFVLTYHQKHDDSVVASAGMESSEQRENELRNALIDALRVEGVDIEAPSSSGSKDLTNGDDSNGNYNGGDDIVENENGGDSSETKIKYLLLHATFPLLARYAEAIKLQMPLRDQSLVDDANAAEGTPIDVEQAQFDCALWRLFRHSSDNAGDRNDLFTAPFQKDRPEMFAIGDRPEDREDFFTSAQRSLLLHTALVSLPEFNRCVSTGAIKEAYPLHDGSHKLSASVSSAQVTGCDNDRQELNLLWVSARNWYRFQPLMLIRRYFGEKVAMYFAWLGAYNMWLLPISVLGLVAFIYGIASVWSDQTVNQICDDKTGAGNLLMCPVCDQACDYWRLKESCMYSRIVHVFDNSASVLYAGLVSLWATCFLEFWKRRQFVLQYQWDVATCELDEVPRPEYTKLHALLRGSRYCFSMVTVVFMVALVLAVLVGVITYRVAMLVVFSSISGLGVFMSNLRLITTGTAACINFVCILLLNQLYKRLAMWLTKLERPRTETDFEDSYTIKMYCFQFVNYYSSLFYIAFLKGSFAGRPGDYARFPMLDGVRLEECDPAGCQVELVVQMLIVFVAKQLLNSATEVGPPLIRRILGSRRQKQCAAANAADSNKPPWLKDHCLTPVDHLQLFDEYLEMVLQFGFVVLFVAAMPLAPLFAMLNNVIEIRLDAWKMVALMRRPVARRARDIGAWFGILTSISALSVVTNAVIVGFTSEQIPKLVYQFTDGRGSLDGYMSWRLSLFNVSDFETQSVPRIADSAAEVNVTQCRYRDFRYPPDSANRYEYSTAYWHVLAARMAFVLVFEHFVLVLKALIDLAVPDKPGVVKEEMKRERELLRKALFTHAKTN
uniref:Anoctamin n=1 Tax=Macrostomum lignano TaxID=282301 RepID=A0A1I8H5H1_9PLAT